MRGLEDRRDLVPRRVAIEAYPDLQLDKDLETPELRKAYEAAGGGKNDKAKADEEEDEDDKKAKKKKAKKDEDEEEKEKPAADEGDEDKKKKSDDEEEEEKPKASDEGSSSDGLFNWISLIVQQDFMVFPAENDVCVLSAQYFCF